MSTEFVQIAAPAVSLFGVVAAPFFVRISNWASTQADRREDFRCCEEFMEKLSPDTPALVVEKWYEVASRGDKAEADEIRYMLTLRFSPEVFRLRKSGKDYVDFVKPGTGDAVGHQFKGLLKYSLIRGGYTLGNLGAYFIGFGLPTIPAIYNKWELLAKDWHAIVLYCLLCAMGFGLGATRIRAMANTNAARELVARSREFTSPAAVEVQPLALVREDQDRTAA